MTLHSLVLALSALTGLALHGGQERGLSAGRDAGRAADLAAIENARKQDIVATLSRDPVALTDLLNLHRRYRTTNVWAKRDGRWQIVAAHMAFVLDPQQAATLFGDATN
ncbi:MAG TPA: hypothetical protein VFT39_04160 [Vicinamibacterales bacterium]|nr:hypothetical protein [Vicinamibacterales bacterium]